MAYCSYIVHDSKARGPYYHLKYSYTPFHSSLPFEHLGQSSVSVNQVTFYSFLELKQCPMCQVFLKSIQHLSLGNDATSSDKNIVIVWLKHSFISKFFAQHNATHIKEHTFEIRRIELKAEFYQVLQLPIGIYMAKILHSKLKIRVCRFEGHLV